MIGIHPVANPQQVNALLDSVREQKLYALVSAAGVLVLETSSQAISTFRTCANAYGSKCGHEFEILSVQDPAGREAIGFAVNAPGAVYLYGVDPHELMLALADCAGGMQ